MLNARSLLSFLDDSSLFLISWGPPQLGVTARINLNPWYSTEYSNHHSFSFFFHPGMTQTQTYFHLPSYGLKSFKYTGADAERRITGTGTTVYAAEGARELPPGTMAAMAPSDGEPLVHACFAKLESQLFGTPAPGSDAVASSKYGSSDLVRLRLFVQITACTPDTTVFLLPSSHLSQVHSGPHCL